MYVDEHPLVLNLDIDQVRCLLGGWRERFAEAGELVRPIALGMAATHLRAGHDVVMPQFLGRINEIERFAAVAHENAAQFAELVVMDTKERSIERFDARGTADDLPWHDDVKELVERAGGRAFLAEMYEQLTDVLEERSGSIVIPSRDGEIQEAYTAMCNALRDMGNHTRSP